MIGKIYKRVKFTVDSISTAQKIITFLIWLLGMSLAGNLYQQGIITEKSSSLPVTACVNTKEVIIQPKPIFIDKPPKIIERTTVIKDCAAEPVKKHEKEWHT